jgi:DNA-directed RNA polymerase subunit RPC12/RpoP
MEITFKCTQCGQDLEIDESGAGLSVPCPQCSAEVIVPASSRHSTLAATVRLTPFPPLKPEAPAAPKPAPSEPTKPTLPARPPAEQRFVTKPVAPSFPAPVAPAVDVKLARTLAKSLRVLAIVVACLTLPAALVLGPGGTTALTVVRILVIVDVGAFLCLASFGLAAGLDLLLDAAERNIAPLAGQE